MINKNADIRRRWYPGENTNDYSYTDEILKMSESSYYRMIWWDNSKEVRNASKGPT